MDNVLNYKISVGTILTAGIAVGGAIYYYNANNNKGDKDKKGTDGYRTPPRQKLTIDTNTSDTKRNRMRTTSRGSTYYEELDDTAMSNLRSPSKRNKKEIRVFMEGAFDVMHYGHANAFRLGRQLGTTLVVGVISSDSIEEAKGAQPLMTDEERCASVRGCKFVDEVIEKTPYVMTRKYLDWVIKTYNIDYVVHGDDPCFVDGVDVYGHVKELGMYRLFDDFTSYSRFHCEF